MKKLRYDPYTWAPWWECGFRCPEDQDNRFKIDRGFLLFSRWRKYHIRFVQYPDTDPNYVAVFIDSCRNWGSKKLRGYPERVLGTKKLYKRILSYLIQRVVFNCRYTEEILSITEVKEKYGYDLTKP